MSRENNHCFASVEMKHKITPHQVIEDECGKVLSSEIQSMVVGPELLVQRNERAALTEWNLKGGCLWHTAS